jgi:hypothetical protein
MRIRPVQRPQAHDNRVNSGEGLIGDRSAPTGLGIQVGTASQGFTLDYYRASLREEMRRLNGRG